MILNTYRSDHPGSLLVLPLVIAVLWLLGPLEGAPPPSYDGMPLYEGIATLFRVHPWTGWVCGGLLALVGSLLAIGMARDLEFPEEHGNLPPLLYPLLMSLFPASQWAHPNAFASIFLMIAFWRLMRSQKGGGPTPFLFDAGFALGVAAQFQISFLLFFPFLWIAAIMLRAIGWRDLFWSFAGLLIPFLFLAVHQYWMDRLDRIPSLFEPIGASDILYMGNSFYLTYAIWGFLGLLFISGFLYVLKEGRNSNMQGKKLRWIFFLLLLFMFGVWILSARYFDDPLAWTILVFPLSFLFTPCFSRNGNEGIGSLAFYLWLLLLVLEHFFSSYF